MSYEEIIIIVIFIFILLIYLLNFSSDKQYQAGFLPPNKVILKGDKAAIFLCYHYCIKLTS